jgi:hypothetical protein
MNQMRRWLNFFLLLFLLLLIDWVLGVLVLHGFMPDWVYLLVNIPFGLIYLGTRLLWTGIRYELFGQALPTTLISLIQIIAVIAQAIVYWYAVRWFSWRKRRMV